MTRDREAARRVTLDVLVDALIVRDERVAALVIADAQALATASADRESLQERGAFAGGAALTVGAERIGVGGEEFLVVLELLPGEVAGVRVVDQCGPLFAGQLP